MFYEALINYSESKLAHALARLDYAKKYETTAHVAKWEARVTEARSQLAATERAALANVSRAA